VILQLPDETPTADLESLVVQETPIVVINSVDDGPLTTIVLDDAAGIRLAMDHLRQLGHTAIGFVGGLPGSATGARREAAFLSVKADAGLPAPEAWVTRLGYAGTEGRAAAVQLLESADLPTALVVANLNAALGVLAEIHARDLRVPADISIVAMHDVWYADATWPPITTVRMPLRELGAAAVTGLMDGGTPVTHTVVDSPAPEIVVRQSTACPRATT
jgi:LacI family transcriptional regulator